MVRAACILLLPAVLMGADASYTGSNSCRPCHAAIYDSYMRTAMARSSGPVSAGSMMETFERSTFRHDRSGYDYRVRREGGKYVMSFGRESRDLPYFIGSGSAARSYALEYEGFLYQAPVAYYTSAHRWDLAPGYARHDYPFLTRPIVPGCLQCHASQIRHQALTQNGYATPPFLEGGVSCERCHGPGSSHLKGGSIVNPAKLEPARRDSVCAQCHLSGEVRIPRAGRSVDSFRPGDLLSDHMAVFIRAKTASDMKVTSHVENLAQSRCKQASGDKLWCGTCHNPHNETVDARAKCRGCHQPSSCRAPIAARRTRADNCVACHMPRTGVTDAEHVVYTDHSIPRRPRMRSTAAAASANLELFGGGTPDARDLGIALAISGQTTKAQTLLKDAADPEALLYLGESYRSTDSSRAIALYERAMKLDPAQLTGSVSLGAIRMEQGNYPEAIRLWTDALAKNPALVLVRFNLAVALLKTGKRAEAESMLQRALYFHPSFTAARQMLEQLQGTKAN